MGRQMQLAGHMNPWALLALAVLIILVALILAAASNAGTYLRINMDTGVLQLPKRSPRALWVYLYAILAGRRIRGFLSPASPIPTLPKMDIKYTRQINGKQVVDYRRLCGFKGSPADLPLPFLQMLAEEAGIIAGAHPSIDLPLLPFPIHVGQKLECLGVMPAAAEYEFTTAITDLRKTDKGLEVDVTTRANLDGTCVFVGVLTGLYRYKTGAKASATEPLQLQGSPNVTWELPADAGRTYANVSGDWNPIHMSKLGGRMFGYKGAIAHGMWTLAKYVVFYNRHSSSVCHMVHQMYCMGTRAQDVAKNNTCYSASKLQASGGAAMQRCAVGNSRVQ